MASLLVGVGALVPGLKHRLFGSKTFLAVIFDEELTIEGRNHTVQGTVLQRNGTNGRCIAGERDLILRNWLTG